MYCYHYLFTSNRSTGYAMTLKTKLKLYAWKTESTMDLVQVSQMRQRSHGCLVSHVGEMLSELAKAFMRVLLVP